MPVEAAPLTAGLELNGTYRLLQPLGRGGMGEVWAAQHTRLPKRVAVKFLLGVGQLGPEWLSRFKREADIASRLHHPNIIEVHDFNVREDGTPYLVMELLQGQDLRARLAAGPLSLSEARGIVLQVASALSLAHREGVVHRDLKPENIFLHRDSDGRIRVKVLDFGISKLAGQSATYVTHENTLLGTPGYMAPEQAMGKHQSLDGRADLFSLAAIVYEMLTGHTLFRGDSLAEVVYKVVHHNPEPLDQVSPIIPETVSRAVAKALSKDPDERQLSVEAFISALDGDAGMAATMLADSDAPASASTPAPSGSEPVSLPGADKAQTGARARSATAGSAPQALADGRRGRRSPWPWLGLGLGLGAVAVVAGFMTWSAQEPIDDGAAGTSTRASEDGSGAVQDGRTGAAHSGSARRSEAASGASLAPSHTTSDSGADEGVAATAQAGADLGAVRPHGAEASGDAAESEPAGRQADADDSAREPAAVRAALDRAEALLALGDHAGALRTARSSLATAKTPRAYAVMAKSYCLRHDLGMTRAMLRNLRGAARRRVQAFCREHGLSL